MKTISPQGALVPREPQGLRRLVRVHVGGHHRAQQPAQYGSGRGLGLARHRARDQRHLRRRPRRRPRGGLSRLDEAHAERAMSRASPSGPLGSGTSTLDYRDPEATAREGIKRLEAFFRSLGLATTLDRPRTRRDERLDEMAEKCTDGGKRTVGNFVKLDRAGVAAVLRLAA